MNQESKRPRVVIVGAGLSGLMAAVHLASEGAQVELLSLLPASRSDSATLRCGLDASFNPRDPKDSPQRHFAETVMAGDFLANQEFIRQMCSQAQDITSFLERIGTGFNRTPEGLLDFSKSAGSSQSRTLYASTATGRAVLHALDGQVCRFEAQGLITRREGFEALSLVKDEEGRARGVVALHQANFELKAFPGDAVLFCTGGLGSLFSFSTQSALSTGLSLSLLYQEGLSLSNMEFIHFSPAVPIGTKDLDAGVALSFGGRVFVERAGSPWYFMEEAYPAYGNRAPFHLLAQTYFQVIQELKKSGSDQVPLFLDLSSIEGKAAPLNGFYETLTTYLGKAALSSPLKLVLSPSYFLGGLTTDNNHATLLPGVYAAGEAQGGFHGAGLLEGNRIISSLFTGLKAASSLLSYARQNHTDIDSADLRFQNEIKRQHAKNRDLAASTGSENPYELGRELNRSLTEALGLARYNNRLKAALEDIDELKIRFLKLSLNDHDYWANQDLLYARRLEGMLSLASVFVLSALYRDESRGCHYKPEFPERRDAAFLKTTKARLGVKGPVIEYEDINLKYMKPSAERLTA